jgi:cytochrome c oxidase cbb3-type subunit III
MEIKDPKRRKEYDGIVENDNPMPRWWLTTFYLTMIFSVIYFGLSQFMGKLKISDEYAHEMTEHKKLAPASDGGDVDYEKVVSLLAKDPAATAAGKEIFTLRCAMCHAADGGGTIGPNLTDNFWINGDGKSTAIVNVILNGVDGKGMPPWKPILSAEEINKVAAFVLTLGGTRPANPKAPQGKEIPL